MSAGASLGANLIGGGVGLLGSFMNYQYQREMMDDQNAYNLPINQLRRLTEAGVNPNVAMSMMNNGSMAPSTYSNIQGPVPADIGSYVGQGMRDYVASRVSESDIAKNEADAAVAEESAKGIKLDNDLKSKELGNYDERFKTEMDEKRGNIAKMAADVKKIDKEIDKINQEIDNLKEQKDSIIAERGLVEYEKMVKSAQARKENAEAEKQELTNKYGVAPGDPWYKYYEAVQKYGADSDEANDAYQVAYDAEYAKSNAGQEGRNESDAKYHFGMYYDKQLIQNVKDAESAMKNINKRLNLLVKNLNLQGHSDISVKMNKKGNLYVSGNFDRGHKLSYAEQQWLNELNQKVEDYNGLNSLKTKERGKGVVKDKIVPIPTIPIGRK